MTRFSRLLRFAVVVALGTALGWWLAQPTSAPVTHTVWPGETLSQIAAEYETTVESLISLNADRYPRLENMAPGPLVAGWRLVVAPGGARPRWRAMAEMAEAGLRPLLNRLQFAGAWPQPAATVPLPASATDARLAEIEASLVAQTNAVRAEAGLSPVQADEDLTRLARLRSQDMIERDYFSHHDPDTGDALLSAYCIVPLGTTACGENLAASTLAADVEANVVGRWMDSEGHRENILRPGWRRVGIGIAAGGRWGYVVTQLFAP
jgi:uncharacterized protein YkwD